MPITLRCPICKSPLNKEEKAFICENKHNFDVAKQGYVNLLLVQNKRSKEPGDNAEMIKSRRNFLSRGFYDQISSSVNDFAIRHVKNSTASPVEILDAGCGEGFYINKLKTHIKTLNQTRKEINYYGVDISKYAIRQATHYDKSINWIVASINDLPFLDSSLDIVICIFSNANFREFSRVLKNNGILIFVSPAPNHLTSLRKIIYEEVFNHTVNDLLEPSIAYFSQVSSQRVSYDINLQSSNDIVNLLTMTPYYWNINPWAKSQIQALEELCVEVDILITVLKKH